ncbi:hypothetical protein JXA84_03900, partial [candidate division WOR-3 bacterium]|nr:hypothetical protein [candidate division WOR-3 bacterium]
MVDIPTFDELNSFVPQIVLEGNSRGKTESGFSAALLSLDVKGFTAITSEVIKKGREGTEVLSDTISTIFDRVIEIVYSYGGFVSSFAGDSFTAVFQYEKNGSILHADQCYFAALKIKDELEKTKIIRTQLGVFDFSMRIGLSQGDVFWKIIENEGTKIFYFGGEALIDCLAAQKTSKPGF